MKALKFLSVILVALVAMAVPAEAQKKPIGGTPVHKHAMARILSVAAVSPKLTVVALKDTLGGILFTVEAGVDVVHAGTTALSTAAGAELKKNPFEYVDKGVAYVDTGLEKGYLFFFNAKI